MKTRKKQYSKEYKLKAVALCEQRESISLVGSELGIRSDMLGRWKREYAQDQAKAFIRGGNSKKKIPKDELSILKKQLREVELERDILKKAVGIFSKSDRSGITL
jgi:transposase